MVNKGALKRTIHTKNHRQAIISFIEHAKFLQGEYEIVSEKMDAVFYKDFSRQDREQLEAYLVRYVTQAENTNSSEDFKRIL